MAVGFYSEVAIPVVATAAITQSRGMTLAGAVPAAAGNGGIAYTGGAIGDTVTVNVIGTAVAEAGAAFNAGTLLEFDSSARLVTRASGAPVARAITAAAAAGSMVEVLLIPN